SSQALDLRKLAFYGEIIQSHILHLYFLVLPDLFGVGSIMPLISSHPDIVKRGMRLKKLADDICRIVVGRHIHPISLTTGGITHLPDIGELKELKNLLKDSTKDLDATLGLFKTFPIPQFSKKREFISLKEDGQYAYYSGNIYSSKRYCIKPKDYKKVIKEYIVPYSTAKHVQGKKGVYMVGAMARVNNNFKQLSKRAREAAKEIGLTLQPYNPFMNNASQLVEVYHCIEDSKKIIDRLISNGLKKEDLKRPKKFGKGVGIVEAPRGMLVHEYTIDKNGIITDANCIIPTAQNLKIMEDDVRNYVPTILGKTKEEITRDIETLVRAYDPCISCSTHIMDVRFDE
ncbi:MAG: nickel-dependent hydrogenase large subunit, partial [Deltaproteobacteria bacterium]|nr:nickel-dependent hydrogenase large subunit [Deltaproteobacteria bacterium]